MIVQAYIRYSAWTVRKPPADLLLFTLADGDQWGAPGSNPSGSLSFCRTRSDAMDPPVDASRFVWAVRVSRRRPLSAGPPRI